MESNYETTTVNGVVVFSPEMALSNDPGRCAASMRACKLCEARESIFHQTSLFGIKHVCSIVETHEYLYLVLGSRPYIQCVSWIR